MKREIRFRGKRLDNGQWVTGYYFETPLTAEVCAEPEIGLFFLSGEKRHCISSQGVAFPVDPATVGQFTGLLDKNGVEIYEGDVLQMWLEDSVEPDGGLRHRMYVVFTAEKGFVLWGERMTLEDTEPLYVMLQWKDCEVIGNIHDNKELIEKE